MKLLKYQKKTQKKTLEDIGMGWDFSYQTPKAQEIKAKTD